MQQQSEVVSVQLNKGMVTEIIASGESLSVEFKSDRSGAEGKRCLEDNTIFEEVVALANTQGGFLLIGVEDDKTISGVHLKRNRPIQVELLRSFIFNNTVPSIMVDAAVIVIEEKEVIAIRVQKQAMLCATTNGRMLQRHIGVHGPETRPIYPFELASHLASLGHFDYSSQPVRGTTLADLDTIEFARLRQMIQRRPESDRALLQMSDTEIAQALGLVVTSGEALVPTIAGLLMVGVSDSIRKYLPTHELLFQILDDNDDVLVNESFKGPLLQSLEEVELRFKAQNREKEIVIGLFRFPIPRFDSLGFREALNNAVLHRDYSRMGSVFVQIRHDHITIASPGGLIAGVTLDNILTHEPAPRNYVLADVFKRVGLVERSGRGVDKIYRGQLRYGRPSPDYSQTDMYGVRVTLKGGEASQDFIKFIYAQEKELGQELPLDELIALNQLFITRRTDADAIAMLIQKSRTTARALLERLVERGLLAAKGERQHREYHFSAQTFAATGNPSGFVRTHGFDEIQQQSMVIAFLEAHGQISRAQVSDLCGIQTRAASYLLEKMRKNNKITLVGKGQKSYYVLADQ
ncbi:MAG: putative DNA binding domain-containing protein [Sporomusaceae bacterium]|nr:putative DNA binding domain-containing protein [Sporomusaceae bacterium]